MDLKLVGGLTLEEALQMAYSDDLDVENIYIEPPECSELTDEDSGDEDGAGLVDNLSRNQLSAGAEVQIRCNEEYLGNTDQCVSPEVSDDEGSIAEELENVDYSNIEWIKGDLLAGPKTFPKPDYEKFKCLTPVDMFEMFFDEDMISFLVCESEKYAQYKNCPSAGITNDEMRCFLSILILTGYNTLPGKKLYWDTNGDMGNKLASEAMRRDRFLTIWKYLHCADNNHIDQSDKFYKLRPFIDKLQNKFLHYFEPEEELNYDESMVKYFGRHSCKQFIRGKPIRFGYKVWSVNTKSGYLVNYMIYQGNDSQVNRNYQTVFGKAAAPFVTMLGELPDHKRNLPYSLYFDNLFTGFNLVNHLKRLGYSGTGTIRDNRVPKHCPLPVKATMKKKTRGDYESIMDRTTGILLVRWLDNNVVTVASTSDGIFPMGLVKRFSRAEKKIIHIQRPCVVGKYNTAMGGTDLMDENIARYRIALRSKKWWWCLFTWLIDATIQNPWILHKSSGNNLTQLQFRREIVKTYLIRYRCPPKKGGRPATSMSSRSFSRVSDDVRYDNRGHLLKFTPDKKKKRCAGENCSSIIRTMCVKCNVGLCVPCNVEFHTSI